METLPRAVSRGEVVGALMGIPIVARHARKGKPIWNVCILYVANDAKGKQTSTCACLPFLHDNA